MKVVFQVQIATQAIGQLLVQIFTDPSARWLQTGPLALAAELSESSLSVSDYCRDQILQSNSFQNLIRINHLRILHLIIILLHVRYC